MSIRSLYLHYPFCRHLCNYCDFYKTVPKDQSSIDSFEKLMDQMIEGHKKLLDGYQLNLKNLDTLFIGGGTPSLWGERGAQYLSKILHSHESQFSASHEATLEVNPGSWTPDGLSAWREAGINRFSLGIQSLQKEMIKSLDRVHSLDDVYQTLEFFSEQDFHFSVDFMLGLPFSEVYKRDILLELEKILEYKPEHISLYILTTKGNYIHRNSLPSEDYIAREYLEVATYLKERGFEHYEVSNFAKPHKKSRHNLAYWRSESVAALGPSATGYIKEASLRYKWKVGSPEFVREDLNQTQVSIENLYMKLRVSDGLKPKHYFPEHHLEKVESLFRKWESEGKVISLSFGAYSLTSSGFLILDSVIGELLPFID